MSAAQSTASGRAGVVLRRLAVTAADVARGSAAYEANEPRDSMYRVATYLLGENVWWGRHAEMADALTVLLLTWNSPFYRFGPFDAAALEECLRRHWATIDHFRRRAIGTLTPADRGPLGRLFDDTMVATKIVSGKNAGRTSRVSAAKALHLLAPGMLPIWDGYIAEAYGLPPSSDPAEDYWVFCLICQEIVRAIGQGVTPHRSKSILKQLDEYNYAASRRVGSREPGARMIGLPGE